METYVPKGESGSQPDGQIAFDAGELKSFTFNADEDFKQGNIVRKDVLDFGAEGFLLSKLLTEKECLDIIKQGEEIGFEAIIGAADNYRSCKRRCIESKELCDKIWERITPFLKDIKIDGDPVNQHINGVTPVLQGLWKPIELNPAWRLCRYYPGQHFAPHYDGFFSKTSDERSLQTMMLYLNGDFKGGSTNFVDDSQELHMGEDGKYCAEPKNITCKIEPEAGLGIIFNHHRLHEGQKLDDGVKYILRTDIMFRNENRVQLAQKEEEAFLIIQEAETREAAGDCSKAAELYRKAFKLSPTIADYYKS